MLKVNPTNEILGSIRGSISKAYNNLQNWELQEEDYFEEFIKYHLESAFVKLRVFLEAAGLPDVLKSVKQLHSLARKDYARIEQSPETGEPYLFWAQKLGQYLTSLECAFGEPKSGTITKDVVEVLRAAQYSITDRKCFDHAPNNERDVHVRIEALLRCVFPVVLHKPNITKPIKNFEPDTGLPSIRTLIEYKFISTNDEAKRVCEELLADTRGYVSMEWDSFIYVIYETKRIQSEKEWTQLLRASGLDGSSNIVVIHGEEPQKRQAKAAKLALPTSQS
jgi:hypothetical protein